MPRDDLSTKKKKRGKSMKESLAFIPGMPHGGASPMGQVAAEVKLLKVNLEHQVVTSCYSLTTLTKRLHF